MSTLYDTLGRDYTANRRPDATIERAIFSALGDAQSVLNVGAGSGSYEPPGRTLAAVEPSLTMIRQRGEKAAPAVSATASALPFQDRAFDAALAVLTVHHWPDKTTGLEELRRVSRRRVVVFTRDPRHTDFWLCDYFPEIRAENRRLYPAMEIYTEALGPVRVSAVPVPHDCSDGFMGAYWRRSDAYLAAQVRANISTFSKLADTASGLRRLEDDLSSGAWFQRYGHLADKDTLDLGYRLVVAEYPEGDR